MPTVAVIAPTSPLGPAVTSRLRGAGCSVVAVDWSEALADELKRVLSDADAVVNLVLDPSATRAVIDAVGAVAAATFVQLSTAAVYGAWADNPVPLTEDEPIRPNPGVAVVSAAAESERVVAEWCDQRPPARVVVLRPAITLSAGQPSFPSGALAGIDGLRSADSARRVQFLHIDDLASAVEAAIRGDLVGTYNVAPDGWLTEEEARAVAGTPTRVAWPRRVVRWRRRSPSDPYRTHGWVVANDRLKATGWAPSATNEEALVLTRRPTIWQRIPPSRKQELTLGATGVVITGVVAAVTLVVRGRRRRRPRS